MCYLSFTFVKYFILQLKSSILIFLGSDVKPAHNTLITGCTIKKEHNAPNSNTFLLWHKYGREISAHLVGKGSRVYWPREIPFYYTSRSISATKSALCTLLIDSLRLHRCRRIYSFTQAILQFHSINLSHFPPGSIMEQSLPLLYFFSQPASRPVLSLNHNIHNERPELPPIQDLASYLHLTSNFPKASWPALKWATFIPSLIQRISHYTHLLTLPTSFKSLLTRLKQVSSWLPINL